MILILGKELDIKNLESQYPQNSFERSLIETMSKTDNSYDSMAQLQFEIEMRKATVNSAKELNRSGMDFAIFRKSKCNREYWSRVDDGGFVLKDNVKPSAAIQDIYKNGPSYATECATAMVIVFYKAVLDVYPPALFDKTFPKIELMNWHHVGTVLRGIGLLKDVKVFLPGDRMYFMNPDVDPETPEWQGENVIMLDTDSFYGHGLGISNKATIIKELNENRSDYAEESAYLMNKASRPDYRKLFDIRQGYHP